ncbi:solute carrier family 13 (sodium-dependent dicarboxylate transporter), member 2/3/5 [Malonomonas rubra DSM 5091]|uniref:Solute carrier family 13 (Sodium-dependent dicarboxylate transporter), member 2/3/5 n=1 Tax=Malonomonas rubra DSM 5091 TaxID=1122189 RepID=A0A1M6HXX9_MALRU|nr:solute carrier family 13 (sodium-dependent dicarboxylate transporter), member 2/3/5 [Malonomonas rubra DSM 5091]
MKRRGLSLLLTILISGAIYWGSGLEPQLGFGLAVLAGIATLWITETFHITITALLIPILAITGGVFDVAGALRSFADPIIFLFLGGFALAATLHKQELDSRLASQVIGIARGRMDLACLLLFAVTALLSMWVSNTATTAMMLPLGLGLLTDHPYKENQRLYWFLLLGIAYSANIGGVGTLVGSPPNAIAAAATGLSFTDWLFFGLPTAVAMFPIVVVVLYLTLRPKFPDRCEITTNQVKPMRPNQWITLLVFILTVSLWLFSKPLAEILGIEKGFDSVVAIAALVLLSALRLVEWKDINATVDWGVLLLFGGGLTLSALLQATGSSIYLAESLVKLMHGAPLLVFFSAVAGFVVMLTEIASNTASSALLVPIFVSVAEAMGLPPSTMAAVIAISASCAFMLPVATPPNALVFGTGKIPHSRMMSVGGCQGSCRLNLFKQLLISGPLRRAVFVQGLVERSLLVSSYGSVLPSAPDSSPALVHKRSFGSSALQCHARNVGHLG